MSDYRSHTGFGVESIYHSHAVLTVWIHTHHPTQPPLNPSCLQQKRSCRTHDLPHQHLAVAGWNVVQLWPHPVLLGAGHEAASWHWQVHMLVLIALSIQIAWHDCMALHEHSLTGPHLDYQCLHLSYPSNCLFARHMSQLPIEVPTRATKAPQSDSSIGCYMYTN